MFFLGTDTLFANQRRDKYESRQVRSPHLTRMCRFVKWCRTSVRDTAAVVRQGRRLRRHLRAQAEELDFDEVPTSSDSSSEAR